MEGRYPAADWNIYVAQASDGDNESGDNDKSIMLMRDGILPLCQYYAYLEIDEPLPGFEGIPRATLREMEAAMEKITRGQGPPPGFYTPEDADTSVPLS